MHSIIYYFPFVFLIIYGLLTGKKAHTFKTFAVGNKNFKTSTLITTLVSTTFGVGFASSILSSTYLLGIEYIFLLFLGITSNFIAVRLMLIRMQEFLPHYSIAESMGALFGNKVRIITALFGILFCAGIVGVQLQYITKTISYFFNIIEGNLLLYSSLSILLLYAMRGGVRAVTTTDVIQFITFIVFLLILIYLVLNCMHGCTVFSHLWNQNKHFMLKYTLNSKNNAIEIFIIPSIMPSIIQRFYMATDVYQAKRAFTYAGYIICLLISLVSILALLLKVRNPYLDPNKLLDLLLSLCSSDAMRGFAIIAILTLAMSTADSCINTASVLFTNDLAPFLKLPSDNKNQLLQAKLWIFITGIVALLLVLYQRDSWKLFLFISSLYMPVVPIPFIMAVFGFRPRTESVLWSMGMGFLATIGLHYFGIRYRIGTVLLVNLLFLIGSYYLLPKMPNTGWVGIKEKKPLLLARQAKRRTLRSWFYAAQNHLFFSPPFLYRIYGCYIIIAHAIAACFVQHTTYYIFYIMAIVWGIFFIKYSLQVFSPNPQNRHPNRTIDFLWNLGLWLFLFIFPTIHFIVHGYGLVHGSILYANLLMANLLWPLSFVFLLLLSFIPAVCLLATPYDTTLSFVTIWYQEHLTLILWCSSITLLLGVIMQYNKVQQSNKLRKKYLSEFRKT